MQDLPTREEYRKQQEELKKKNTQQDNISKREEIRKKAESLEQNYRPKKKKLRFKKWVIAIFLLFFLSLLTISGLEIYNWLNDNNKTNNLQDDIVDNTKIKEKKDTKKTEQVNPPENKSDDYWDYMKMNLLEVDFNKLLQKNSDTVGWIEVKGTNINYPIVQTTDNNYYLHHAFDKSKNDAGWVYMDYRNDPVNFDQNTIIYAHSRYNGTMFGSLKNILNSSWYNNKNNYIIRLSTPTENTMWQVFSVYTIEKESYYITTNFSTTESYDEFLKTMKKRSNVNFTATPNTNDKILTLSTCKDNFGSRVVMQAKLIKREVR